MSFILIQSQL
ncbi:hypothetical protein Ahy_B09g097285 isoform E [Arachis hypogaea]|uniref:Uncharacterized protein n=1 Tax=Arachis hypogaea TaxID=3818 RepID=A0A444XNW9_ARAHY|nr:hypothetical protein Ahy_B09g097285 isoform E [Arachis hypogaea]